MWTQKTLSKEQLNDHKAKLHGANLEKVASEALYEMDISMLEAYLFGQSRDIQPAEIIDVYFSPDRITDMDKESMTKVIESGRPKSNWQRYFEHEVSIDQLEKNLCVIRKGRNKVAHVKHYCKKDFEDDKAIISKFITKLDEAILKVEARGITANDVYRSPRKIVPCLCGISPKKSRGNSKDDGCITNDS